MQMRYKSRVTSTECRVSQYSFYLFICSGVMMVWAMLFGGSLEKLHKKVMQSYVAGSTSIIWKMPPSVAVETGVVKEAQWNLAHPCTSNQGS